MADITDDEFRILIFYTRIYIQINVNIECARSTVYVYHCNLKRMIWIQSSYSYKVLMINQKN